MGTALDNLLRAEKLGWLADATAWLTLRRLRNRLIHEYIQDAELLHDALMEAHGGVPMLLTASRSLAREAGRRLDGADATWPSSGR